MSDAPEALIDFAVSPEPTTSTTSDTTETADESSIDTEGPSTDETTDGETSQDTDGESADGDSKKPLTSSQLRQMLKAMRDSSPEYKEAARALNDGYSRFEASKEIFPGGVTEMREFKSTIDAFGGLEGLTNMRTQLGEMEVLDQALANGDPKALAKLLQQAPDGFKKLGPHYLEELAKIDSKAFEATILPHFVQLAEAAGLYNFFELMTDAVKDNPQAAKLLDEAKAWGANQRKAVEAMKKSQESPERSAWMQEKEQWEKQRNDEFTKDVQKTVGSHIDKEIGSQLKPYQASLMSMTQAQRDDLVSRAYSLVKKYVSLDKVYAANITPLLQAKTKDRDKIVNMQQAKVSGISAQVVKDLVTQYGLKVGAVSTATQKSAKPNVQGKPDEKKRDMPKVGGKVSFNQLDKPPKPGELNMDEPGAWKARFAGKGRLKTGEYVQWKVKK